jgi:hypothetical protein
MVTTVTSVTAAMRMQEKKPATGPAAAATVRHRHGQPMLSLSSLTTVVTRAQHRHNALRDM